MSATGKNSGGHFKGALRSNPQRRGGHFHGNFGITITGDYTTQLKAVITQAVYRGYKLPTPFQLKILDFYIRESIIAGTWGKNDLGYIFEYNSFDSETEGDTTITPIITYRNTIEKFCQLNLVNPTKFELTPIYGGGGYPRYTKRGFTIGQGGGAGVYSYWNMQYTPATDSVKYTQNNAGVRMYMTEFGDSISQTSNTFGSRQVSAPNYRNTFNPFNGSAQATGNINTLDFGSSTFATGVTTAKGYHNLERTASNLTTYYKDAVSLGTASVASTALSGMTLPMWLMNQNIAGALTQTVRGMGSFFLGGALGSTLQKTDFEIYTEFRRRLRLKQ